MKRHHLLGGAVATVAICLTSRARAELGEGSFTPTSLQVPLHGVRLGGADASKDVALFACAGAQCVVDMADETAVAGLFTGGVDVAAGTYDHVTFDTCDAGATSYTVLLTGAVNLGGLTFQTSANLGGLLTVDVSLGGPTPLVFAGCSFTMRLPSPLTIAGGDDVVISSFFSLSDIAWGALDGSEQDGCASNALQSVCSALPVPVAHVGTVTPTIDTYFITEDVQDTTASRAGGQLLILRDGAGSPFGGFSRRLYSTLSVPPRVTYDTTIKDISPVGSSFAVTTWGEIDDDGNMTPFGIEFAAFQLATHSGNLFGPGSSDPIPYLAVKQ